MTQGIGTGESPEIRRALERLQSTLDILSDRYRDLRKERRSLRDRIEQLEREREASSLSLSTRLESAAHDRKRAIEFEERALQAEKAQAELQNRIAEMEQAHADRDALIADQADTIERQRERLEENRLREEQNWSQEERLREEIETLREQLASAQTEAGRFHEQVRELEQEHSGRITFADQNTEELTRELSELREQVTSLEMERAELEQTRAQLTASEQSVEEMARQISDLREQIVFLETERTALQDAHAQLAGRFDAAARDAAITRNRCDELESEAESLRTQLSHAGAAHEGDLAVASRAEAEIHRLGELIASREEELRSLHEALERLQAESRGKVAELEGTINELQVERERVLKTLVSVEADRDSARGTVESLLVRLKQLEASDDERLTAQRARIDELTRDLTEALDMAARKETETMLAQTEVERLQRHIVELTERRDLLAAELEKVHIEGTNGLAGPSNGISDAERQKLVEQLRDAITLIDKHLGEG